MPIVVNVNSSRTVTAVLDYATEAEAVAGTNTTKIMTPYRTKQSLTANAPVDTIQTLGTLSANTTIDIKNGKIVTLNLGANITLTLTAPETQYGELTIVITNPATQYTVTWPSTVKWNGNTYTALSASTVNIIKLITINKGSAWLGDITYSSSVA